jgi:16S rRNA (uracil1498-N3)-methyltransferase
VKQFILTKEPENNIVRLEGDDYHYLVRVRRLAAGEFFTAILPDGTETLIQVLSVERGILTGKCEAERSIYHPDLLKMPPVILFQAMPKGDKMDIIVRQAAEGGITEIVPFMSEFSFVRHNNPGGQKFSRWERIIKEARQQSGSKIATIIHSPLTFKELFDYWSKLKEIYNNALGLLFHHLPGIPYKQGCKGLEKESLHGYLNINPNVVVLAVGPEGGFSEKEVSVFLENGFKPLTIGDTILRAETAALYCAAAVRILLLERESWELKHPKTDSV